MAATIRYANTYKTIEFGFDGKEDSKKMPTTRDEHCLKIDYQQKTGNGGN